MSPLFDDDQASWLAAARADLINRLGAADPSAGFGVVTTWEAELDVVPVPVTIVQQIGLLLRPELQDAHTLTLRVIPKAP